MAVSDLKFKATNKKLKKKDLNSLPIEIAPDVLKFVLENRTNNQTIVGFASESPLTSDVILEKYNLKPVFISRQ